MQKLKRLLLPSSPMPDSELEIAWYFIRFVMFLNTNIGFRVSHKRWVKAVVILNMIQDLCFNIIDFSIA